MPLPRFDRLTSAQRAHILGVAREAFARDSFAAVSYNKIIVDVGISKTSAYQYFDGKDDLFQSVLDDVAHRVLHVLGCWDQAGSPDAFWAQLVAGSNRLVAHLANSPEDLALMDAALSRTPDGQAEAWLGSLIADGLRLGIIDSPLELDLLASVTAAVFDALDRWAITRLRASGTVGQVDPAGPADVSKIDTSATFETLARVWGTLPSLRMPTPVPPAS